jgi:histidinol-phosphate/aromatic aminotransferase/cobyric acid decarboxylase-like protein
VVTAAEVKQVIEGIPKTMPILIDEACHHYVDDPAYATAMRIGYAVAPAEMIRQMRVYAIGSVNVLAKWARWRR